MKNIISTAILVAMSLIVVPHVAAQPSITAQPRDRVNNIGDNAHFSVTATDASAYQWQFNGEGAGQPPAWTDIPAATDSALNFTISSGAEAGEYRVIVSDSMGMVTSDEAVLEIPFAGREIFTQWNCNNAPYTGTAPTAASIGTGSVFSTAGVASDTGAETRVGSPSDPILDEDLNKQRVFTQPRQSVGNKNAGIQFDFSTLGYENIVVTWEQRQLARAGAYWRGQYTLDRTAEPVEWVDRIVADHRTSFVESGGQTLWNFLGDDLSDVPGAANNPDFAYRVVAEWESTATGSGEDAFVPVDPENTYNNTGQPRNNFDMITVLGTEILQAPVIVSQPQSQTRSVGGSVTFSVDAVGGGLEYQWRFKPEASEDEPEDIEGATDADYSVEDIQLGDAGSYSVIVTNSAGFEISENAVLTVVEEIPSGDRFWSGDGEAPGGGGTWDTTLSRWGLDAGGPFEIVWDNENLDSAVFVGDGPNDVGTVTIGEPITVNTITVTNSTSARYSFSGSSAITFSGENPGVFVNGIAGSGTATNHIVVSAPLAGSVLVKTGGGRLDPSDSGNSVEKWIVKEGIIGGSIANNMFGTGNPAEEVSDFIVLDGGGIGIHANISLGANRGIYLADNSGNKIGVDTGTRTFTIDARMTGPGGISFPGFASFPGGVHGANGNIIISNPDNDYEGETLIITCEIRPAADHVFPGSTTLNMTTGNLNGRINLNGTHQTVAKVIIDSTGNARVIDSVGGGSLTAGEFDLRRSNHASTGTGAVLAGSGNLIKTTAGTITISGVNTYSGNTIISEGTLRVIGSGSFANSPVVSIAAEAVLDVSDRTDGTFHLGAAQTLRGGGTVSGTISLSGTVAPGDSIGTLSTGPQTWNGGGVYEVEIAGATGAPGTDWDHLNISGDLDVQASGEDRFTIKVVSADAIAGFDNDESYSWTIASAGGGIVNFDTDKFAVDVSEVVEDIAGGVFSVEASGGAINLTFTPNPGPAASPRNLTRAKGIPVRIAVADLLAESTSHADGSPRELIDLGAASSGTVAMDESYIYYLPSNDENDSFTYTVGDVRDYRDGDTVRTAQGSINITVVNAVGASTGVEVSEGTATISFAGIPGYSYEVQRSTDLETWVTVDTIVAPGNGLFEFVDDFSDLGEAPGSAFYRLRQP